MTQARLIWLDLARTAAILGMILYHFCYDLVLFGLFPAQMVSTGPLRMLAIVVAASFIGLAGVSLVVAHGGGLRRGAFAKRLGLLMAAAAAISLMTYLWVPQSFIFFGILHSIALCSVLGLAFLPLPFWLTGAAALFTLWLPRAVAWQIFDAPILNWSGLGTFIPPTLDYEPIFPWFAAFLVGMTLAKAAKGRPLMQPRPTSPLIQTLSWPGRYSLWIYLAHQPVIIAGIWLVLQVL